MPMKNMNTNSTGGGCLSEGGIRGSIRNDWVMVFRTFIWRLAYTLNFFYF